MHTGIPPQLPDAEKAKAQKMIAAGMKLLYAENQKIRAQFQALQRASELLREPEHNGLSPEARELRANAFEQSSQILLDLAKRTKG